MARLTKEDDDNLISAACESIHTGFRKGSDGGGDVQVHNAITNMDGEQYGKAVAWALWALSYGPHGYHIVPKDKYKVVRKGGGKIRVPTLAYYIKKNGNKK